MEMLKKSIVLLVAFLLLLAEVRVTDAHAQTPDGCGKPAPVQAVADTPDYEAKAKAADAEKSVADARAKMDAAIDAYASKEPKISQLVDLALLANGLLKGESLSAFIARSLSLMK